MHRELLFSSTFLPSIHTMHLDPLVGDLLSYIFVIALEQFFHSLQTSFFSIYHPFTSSTLPLFITLLTLTLNLSLLTLTFLLSHTLLLTLTLPLLSPGIFNSKGLSMSLNGLQGLDSKIPDARLLINSLACLIEKSDVSNLMSCYVLCCAVLCCKPKRLIEWTHHLVTYLLNLLHFFTSSSYLHPFIHLSIHLFTASLLSIHLIYSLLHYPFSWLTHLIYFSLYFHFLSQQQFAGFEDFHQIAFTLGGLSGKERGRIN